MSKNKDQEKYDELKNDMIEELISIAKEKNGIVTKTNLESLDHFSELDPEDIEAIKERLLKENIDYDEEDEVVNIEKVNIAAAEGAVEIYELQFPGKKRMTVEQFLAGNTFPKGINLQKEV